MPAIDRPLSDCRYCNRANCFVKLEMWEEAAADAGEAIARDETYGKAFALRGAARMTLENYDDAAKDYNQASELVSNTIPPPPSHTRSTRGLLGLLDLAVHRVDERYPEPTRHTTTIYPTGVDFERSALMTHCTGH